MRHNWKTRKAILCAEPPMLYYCRPTKVRDGLPSSVRYGARLKTHDDQYTKPCHPIPICLDSDCFALAIACCSTCSCERVVASLPLQTTANPARVSYQFHFELFTMSSLCSKPGGWTRMPDIPSAFSGSGTRCHRDQLPFVFYARAFFVILIILP